MSCVIRTLIENANDLILVLDDFNENMSVKDLKVWLPAFADILYLIKRF